MKAPVGDVFFRNGPPTLLDRATEAFSDIEGINRVSVCVPPRPGKEHILLTLEHDLVEIPVTEFEGHEVKTEVVTKEELETRKRRQRQQRFKARPCEKCDSKNTVNMTPFMMDAVQARCHDCGHIWRYSTRHRK